MNFERTLPERKGGLDIEKNREWKTERQREERLRKGKTENITK